MPGGQREIRVSRDLRGYRARQARQEQPDPRGHVVNVVNRAYRGQLVQPDRRGREESRVFRGRQVRSVPVVKPVPEEKRATLAARRGRRVTQALKAIPDLLALPVKKANPVSGGHRGYRGHRVLPEREGRQAKQDLRVNRGPKEPRVLLAHRDRRESGELRGLRV